MVSFRSQRTLAWKSRGNLGYSSECAVLERPSQSQHTP